MDWGHIGINRFSCKFGETPRFADKSETFKNTLGGLNDPQSSVCACTDNALTINLQSWQQLKLGGPSHGGGGCWGGEGILGLGRLPGTAAAAPKLKGAWSCVGLSNGGGEWDSLHESHGPHFYCLI